MWETWWVWIAAGLVLAIFEVIAPGYLFVGFALGAVATGLILWADLWLAGWMDGSLARHLLVFAALSVAIWLGLRQLLGIRRGQVKTFDRDINED